MTKIDKTTRKIIIGLIEDKPEISKAVLKEIIRPHYHPDKEALVEQTWGDWQRRCKTTLETVMALGLCLDHRRGKRTRIRQC